jgi:gluconokinase
MVIMGVAGCGKSSLAAALATSEGLPMIDGDSLHSAENLLKMNQGIALTDTDRASWLGKVAQVLTKPNTIVTCSALKKSYREQLRAAQPRLPFVFLDITPSDALARVQARPGHFFSPTLIASQFATLESPVGEPDVLRINATDPLTDLVHQVRQWMAIRSTQKQPV